MLKTVCSLSLLIIAFTVKAQKTNGPSPARSEWVYHNTKDVLSYKTLPGGDRIMDFSYAGYMGGGVSIPSPAVKITLTALKGDNTDAIQNAIDQVSQMKMVDGFRGTVLLKPGVYNCDRTINITASGVVLRGSGSGEHGTIINMTGKAHNAISVRGNVTSKVSADSTFIVDRYVASGTNLFSVADASGLSVNDTIRIRRPVTEAWVRFMGMHDMVRNDKPQTWISGEITTDRVISKIEKNTITVSLPLTDSYDSKYLNPPGVRIHRVSTSGMLTQIGIENLRIIAAPKTVTINEGHHRAFTLSGVRDAWARNIEVYNTVNSISVTGKRITLEHISIVHELPTEGAAKPADLNGSGEQLLFKECVIKGDNLFFFGTGAKVTGPVVLLNCVFTGNGWIQPHQRWATGLLIDNCQVPDGGIDFMNRGSMGSGHGWTIGWAVAWNCRARSFLNQQPPGAANWVIGSTGEQQRKARPFGNEPVLAEGIYDSHGQRVDPSSLYLSQLFSRLGAQAVKNIGY